METDRNSLRVFNDSVMDFGGKVKHKATGCMRAWTTSTKGRAEYWFSPPGGMAAQSKEGHGLLTCPGPPESSHAGLWSDKLGRFQTGL